MNVQHVTPSPAALSDIIWNTKLSRRIKQALEREKIATFRGITAREPNKLFRQLKIYLSVYDFSALNAELALRNIRPIRLAQGFTIGPQGLASHIVKRLWKCRCFEPRSLCGINRTKLTEKVGSRNVPALLRYLTSENVALTEYIGWYADQGFSEEGFQLLWSLNIQYVSDLFLPHAETYDRRLSQRIHGDTKKVLNQYRTVRYARWWFAKNYPELAKKQATAP